MPKETFPTDNDIKRLLQLKRYENLYEGDHFKEFGIKEYFKNVGGKGKYIYIAINLAASISEYFADMVVGEDIQFKVKDKEVQKKIDAISKDNNLAITLYESAMSQSEFGFVPIRVRKDEETNKSIIEEIPVDQYFPEETKIINGKAKRVVLGSYLTILDEKEDQEITIEWGNILPTDELSLTQILGEQVTVGLKSRRRAVKELQKLDEEALDEELSRIESENQAQVPSMSSPPQIKSTEELINA